ncbi:MAG: uracil-DNA glycosylase [Gemmatimonadaceae bacterium]
MDARERLRTYLEQRRELGDGEFVLDSLSVDEAMATIDAMRSRRGAAGTTPPRAALAQVREPTASGAAPRPEAAPPAEAPHIKAASADEHRVESAPAAAPDVRLESPTEGATGGADGMKAFEQGLVVGTQNGAPLERNPFADVKSLKALAKLVEDCTRCPLYQNAIHGVPGEGDPKAGLMVVGEAPGATEDETGRPFVGQSGALLTKILEAIDLKREDVFIVNVVKHRPPANRNPTADEVAACSPYLVRQIQIIKPKVILALGTFAAQTLLDTKTPIGKLRGAVHSYHGTPLIVTYHPAALLRNPAWKRPTWEDVKLARSVLDSAKS